MTFSLEQQQICFGVPASQQLQHDAEGADPGQAAASEEPGLQGGSDAQRIAFAPPPGLSAPYSSSLALPFTAASEGGVQTREPSGCSGQKEYSS